MPLGTPRATGRIKNRDGKSRRNVPEPLTSEAPRPLTSRRPGTREKGQTRRAADRDPHGPRSRAEPWAAMRRGRWSWTRPGPVGRGARAWCRGEPAARAVARFPVSGGESGSAAETQDCRTRSSRRQGTGRVWGGAALERPGVGRLFSDAFQGRRVRAPVTAARFGNQGKEWARLFQWNRSQGC